MESMPHGLQIRLPMLGADPGIYFRGGGGPRLKSRLFTKVAVTAERIEFKIIQPINC